MAKDLTTSKIDRQNILNNPYALQTIQENLDIKFVNFNGTLYVTKQQTADYYGVDVRTITNCLNANEDELTFNGYKVLQGNELKEFKLQFGKEMNFPTKMTVLGVFDFRSFLNIGMLLTTSEKAKQLRSMMLDVVIATITKKAGGSTKFINRRDKNYVTSAIIEEDYHKKLTDAIKDYVDGHKTYKYSQIMDMIYKVVFCEKAAEYKKLLELSEKDNLRRTLYAEVLVAVSSFENATAEAIKTKVAELGVLSVKEVEDVINELSKNPLVKPIVDKVPMGTEHLSKIMEAMEESRNITIDFHDAKADEGFTVAGSPYCVRLYQQRWYVVLKDEDGIIDTYSLDRITNLRIEKTKFLLDQDFDAEQFFKYSFGVRVNNEGEPMLIKLKVHSVQRDYFRTLPLHHTQKEIETQKDYSIFTIEVVPTVELMLKLLSYGSLIKVLEPTEYIERIKEEVEAIYNIYFQNEEEVSAPKKWECKSLNKTHIPQGSRTIM